MLLAVGGGELAAPGADVRLGVLDRQVGQDRQPGGGDTFIAIDFQRLRRSAGVESAPLLAASIFLDILNVFLFFLQIFRGGDNR